MSSACHCEEDPDEAIPERRAANQTRPEYRYSFEWHKHDVLVWENIGTLRNAIPDYRPYEHRLIKRCQGMATKFAPVE